MTLATEYAFVLPRGYVDRHGTVHRTGSMRLATARDELEPLRDPTVSGPDDPRLTVLVLARVVTALGSVELVTAHEIENLFTVDMAFLQDFYGVINFGTQAEYEALLAEQQAAPPPAVPVAVPVPGAPAVVSVVPAAEPAEGAAPAFSGPRRGVVEEIGARGR